MGSRGIYHDGWFADTFGPRIPWLPGIPKGVLGPKGELLWNPNNDPWELYNLDQDWTQANDLAAKNPEKLAEMKALFLEEFAKNQGFPVGGGLWVPVVRPDLRISTPYTEWTFAGNMTRMPEFTAPALGNKENVVTIDAEIPANANGVIYALGAFSGGLSLYVQDGVLSYEYNLFEINRTHIRATEKLPTGKVQIEVSTKYAVKRPAGPLDVTIKVNGKEVAKGQVPVSAPLMFTANDCLDIGTDLGSPVSVDYFENAPFAFNGKINTVHVKYLGTPAEQQTEKKDTVEPAPAPAVD
jgi:arylsulfatase